MEEFERCGLVGRVNFLGSINEGVDIFKVGENDMPFYVRP
jgi:hypothetical protein